MLALVFWVIVSLVTVAGATPLTAKHFRTRSRDQEMARFLASHQLPLPDSLRDAVMARAIAHEGSVRRGGLAGMAVGVAAGVVASLAGQQDLGGMVIVLLTVLGMWVGSYVGTRGARRPATSSAPRVARASATDLADYSTRDERRAVALAMATMPVALAAAVGVWWLVPVRPEHGVVQLAVMSVGAVLAVAAGWLSGRAARQVVEQPQRASSDLVLAWDDALRADTVRDLLDAGVTTGIMVVFALLATAATWVLPWEVRRQGMSLTLYLGVGALVVGVLCWAVVLVPWSRGRSVKNPSRRLWSGHQFEVVQ